jgi:hypothetical protein
MTFHSWLPAIIYWHVNFPSLPKTNRTKYCIVVIHSFSTQSTSNFYCMLNYLAWHHFSYWFHQTNLTFSHQYWQKTSLHAHTSFGEQEKAHIRERNSWWRFEGTGKGAQSRKKQLVKIWRNRKRSVFQKGIVGEDFRRFYGEIEHAEIIPKGVCDLEQ